MSDLIDPGSDPGWAELSRERGSLFSSPPWVRALARTYGFDVRASVSRDGDALSAGVPFVAIEDAVGRRVVSLPFSDYCDPVLNGGGSWNAVAEPLFAAGCPITLRCLHETGVNADPRFQQTGEAFWHAIDIDGGPEEMLAALRGSARRNIRAAERQGVTVEVRHDRAAIETFHEMHCELRRRKYRLLAQPLAFFEHIWEEFAPSGDIAVLFGRLEERTIAGMVFISWADTLYYKFGASVSDGLSVRPNDLLFWEAMKYAQERGLSRIDLGLSDADQEGLVRFKRKFASEEGNVTFLRHVPAGYADARQDELRQMLGTLTDLFTQDGVPDDVTRRAGEQLYRYFC